MITYTKSAFGLNLLFRIHGSATYRACLPGSLAVGFFLLIRLYFHHDKQGGELGDPYTIGIIVSGITFLIVFRASQGYSRYWEAASAVYQMLSKWLDVATHTGVYHLQCHHYDKIKPPSYFDYPELNAQFLTRDRERMRDLGSGDMDGWDSPTRTATRADRANQGRRAQHRSINLVQDPKIPLSKRKKRSTKGARRVVTAMSARDMAGDNVNPAALLGLGRLDGNWGALFEDSKSTYYDPHLPNAAIDDKKGFSSVCGGRTPPLFLQELAHLTSLMAAVALSTLRNDVDGSESPLDLYEAGAPWPPVDPGDDPILWDGSFQRLYKTILFFIGFARSPVERTQYNALRPLPVVGGVSDNEIRFLQMARGPSAKTELCWSWLTEFITREHLAGSLGDVGPPIISRLSQFLSDGMLFYNDARKIMFIPFPFVHAQLSAALVLVMIPAVPFLMDQYTEDLWLGITLSFCSVTCLSGILEVARELENPFRNVPNELPIVTIQAEFNEALLTMYAGYHPDLFWEDVGRMFKVASDLDSIDESIGSDEVSSKPSLSNEATYPLDGSSRSEIASNLHAGDVKSGTWNTNQEYFDQTSTAEKSKSRSVSSLPLSNSDNHAKASEVKRLKNIVEQQGRLMERMMEEQARLSALVQSALKRA